MEQLTREQFLERYGKVPVVFDAYYKFQFSFVGEIDGKELVVCTGENADDIYRFEVYADAKVLVEDLDITQGYIEINNVIVESYNY